MAALCGVALLPPSNFVTPPGTTPLAVNTPEIEKRHEIIIIISIILIHMSL
jgi:hypothetical protein